MSHDPFVYTAVQYENALAQCAALVARAVAAETALARATSEWETWRTRATEAETALAAAHNVIRRYRKGWHRMGDVRGDRWVHPIEGEGDLVTPAEADALQAALLDVPDQPAPEQ